MEVRKMEEAIEIIADEKSEEENPKRSEDFGVEKEEE